MVLQCYFVFIWCCSVVLCLRGVLVLFSFYVYLCMSAHVLQCVAGCCRVVQGVAAVLICGYVYLYVSPHVLQSGAEFCKILVWGGHGE